MVDVDVRPDLGSGPPQPRRRAPHRGACPVHAESSSSPARPSRVEPLDTHRVVVERQRQTCSCDSTRAPRGQSVQVRAGCGGEWEQHLARRPGELEHYGEHRQDGAEAIKPWQPSASVDRVHTLSTLADGRLRLSWGRADCSATKRQQRSGSCMAWPQMGRLPCAGGTRQPLAWAAPAAALNSRRRK